MKNSIKLPVLGSLILCLMVGIILLTPNPPPFKMHPLPKGTLSITTAVGKREFTVEIAKTPKEQSYGLMNRPSMPADHGMVFLWEDDGMRDMWMKDTLIPLDMLFVDNQGAIVHIASDTVPNSQTVISAGRPTRVVIELLGGITAKEGIKVGDRIHIDIPAP